MRDHVRRACARALPAALALCSVIARATPAQDRLKLMPGYDNWASGLGKRTLDDVYRKLGQTEVDDLAAGVKALWNRPWFAKDRVGILGISYGGYAAAMALLRYPDVFAAAIAMSPVTDWRNYDTIYAERYMGLPDENKDGYDKGSAMSYVNDLKGDLLIFYGTVDNNVHTTNSLQLIKALVLPTNTSWCRSVPTKATQRSAFRERWSS